MSFLHQIAIHARLWPNKVALVQPGGQTYTYGLLGAAILSASARLSQAGVTDRDIASIEVADQAFRTILLLALLRNGVCAMNSPEGGDEASAGLSTVRLRDEGAPSVAGRSITIGADWFAAAKVDAKAAGRFSNGSPAVVWFTSGTTGERKALALTWDRLNLKVNLRKTILSVSSPTRVLMIPAMGSSYGAITTIACLASGAAVISTQREADLLNVAELFAIDYVVASSFQLARLVELAREKTFAFTGVRGGYVAGGLASPALLMEALVTISPNLLYVYASTEAGDTALGRANALVHTMGCVGPVAPWANVEIVGEDLQPLPHGAQGQIRVRTDCEAFSFDGPGSKEPDDHAWFYPGDMGSFTPQGELVVRGRVSELINLGGRKFAPEPLEAELAQHPKVRAVAIISAIGPGASVEQAHVFLAADGMTNEEALSWVTGKLAHFGPLAIHLGSQDLPRTSLGKIARIQLRAFVEGAR